MGSDKSDTGSPSCGPECYQNSLVQLLMAEAQEESDNNPGCIWKEQALCVQLNRKEQNGENKDSRARA